MTGLKFSLCCILIVAVSCPTVLGFSIADWGTCKKDDPNLSDCLGNIFVKSLHSLKEGIKEIGVPPLDPFVFDKMDLKSGGTGPVNMALMLENLKIYEMSNFSDLKVDASKFDKLIMNIKMKMPKIHVETAYKISGRILAMPLKGEGDLTVDMLDNDVDVTFSGTNDDDHFNVKAFEVTFIPKNMKLNFSNLFNGDKKLGDATNKVLNENWKIIHKEFLPMISTEFARLAMPVFNKILATTKLSEIVT